MVEGLSEKARRILKEKRLTPIKILYHDYVILCTDEQGRKVVLKTDNMERETEIYEVLMRHFDSDRWRFIDFVRFLDYTHDYILMEFVEGIDPHREILDGEQDIMRFSQFPLIVQGFWDLKDFLSVAARDVAAIDVEMTKPNETTISEWLRRKPDKWADFIQKKEGAAELLQPVTKRILVEALDAQAKNPVLQRPLVPQFGVYGPHQIIVRDGRVVLFDFGGHLKWRPELYDAVWPLWVQLLHFKESRLEANRRDALKKYIDRFADAFWAAAPTSYQEELGRRGYDTLFLAILIERLVGCHVDIIRREHNHLREMTDRYIGKLQRMVDDLLVYYAGHFRVLKH